MTSLCTSRSRLYSCNRHYSCIAQESITTKPRISEEMSFCARNYEADSEYFENFLEILNRF